jgi:hypothetical protein
MHDSGRWMVVGGWASLEFLRFRFIDFPPESHSLL